MSRPPIFGGGGGYHREILSGPNHLCGLFKISVIKAMTEEDEADWMIEQGFSIDEE